MDDLEKLSLRVLLDAITQAITEDEERDAEEKREQNYMRTENELFLLCCDACRTSSNNSNLWGIRQCEFKN